MRIDFSKRQEQTIGISLTLLAALVIILVVIAGFYLLTLFFSKFSNVFFPLALAGILAMVLNPYYQIFSERRNIPPIVGVIIVFLTMIVPMVIFMWVFGAKLVDQGEELVEKLPALAENSRKAFESRIPALKEYWVKYEVTTKLQELLETKGGMLAETFQEVAGSAFEAGKGAFAKISGSLGWVMFPIYLAFFLMAQTPEKSRLEPMLPFLKKETREDIIYLVDEFLAIMVSFFRGQFIVALGQGVLFAIGFSMVGLSYGFVIGLMLGFLNIVPYLGSMIGLAVALPLAYFQADGGFNTLALVIIVFAVVQMIEGYILTPKVMGDRTGLHPVVIMVALFFWGTALNGIMGMILAIPLTAFLVVFWRLLKTKYIKEIV